MTDGQSICSNPECRVAETGVCAKGYDPLDACPEYSVEDVASLDAGEDDSSPERSPDEDAISLESNRTISEDEITGFRARFRTQTVVLVGEQKTGKTTLLAAIYGLLCKGPVGGRSFVGSQTLYSFAERNHLALANSEQEIPTTPRTSRGDKVGFFHLRLRARDHDTDLLIADRSGEAFEDARVNTDLMAPLIELSLADRVCFLLDAARLTEIESRAHYRRIFKQAIRALIDNAKIPKTATIEVLINKIDRLSNPDGERDLQQEVTDYEQELLKEFGSSGHDFQVHQICALPRANVKLGFVGISDLLARWSPPPVEVEITPRPLHYTARWIDRLPAIWS